MKVFVVSSSQLGAKAQDTTNAIELMNGPGISHYWDGDRHLGAAVSRLHDDHTEPAWDMWMLYAPGITWEKTVTAPSWWEHQLPVLDKRFAERRLDADRFAAKAIQLAGPARAR